MSHMLLVHKGLRDLSVLGLRFPAAPHDVSGLRAEGPQQRSLAKILRLSIGGCKTPILHQHRNIVRNKVKQSHV